MAITKAEMKMMEEALKEYEGFLDKKADACIEDAYKFMKDAEEDASEKSVIPKEEEDNE